MLQRNTAYLSVMHRTSSRSDRPGFYGRREEPITIVSRGKVDPGLPFTALGHVSGLLLVPCGYYCIHRRSQEIVITRGFSHWQEHKMQTLSLQYGLSQSSDTKLSQKTAMRMSPIPRGISAFIKKSYERINKASRPLCSLQKVRLR